MIEHADFAYAQARVQARHGERLDHDGWRLLSSSRSLGHLLQAARETSLRAWVAPLHSHDPRDIERGLRSAFLHHVHEVALWLPPKWRPACRWSMHLADLEVVDVLLADGPVPSDLRFDPTWEPFVGLDREARIEVLRRTDLEPLLDGPGDASTAARWLQQWRRAWPRTTPRQRQGLHRLEALASRHLEAMRDPDADGWQLRDALATDLSRLFRRDSGQPAAVFCHVALVALDLERLRGALLRRALFPHVRSKVAWV